MRAAIRAGNPAPAQYVIPYCSDMKDMEKPEMKQKYTEGPVAVMNVMRTGMPNMGKYLTQWFVFILCRLVLHRLRGGPLDPAGTRRTSQVFRVVGAVGFVAYGSGSGPRVDLDGEAVEE